MVANLPGLRARTLLPRYVKTDVMAVPARRGGVRTAIAPNGADSRRGYFWQPIDFDPARGGTSGRLRARLETFVIEFQADGSYAWRRTWAARVERRRLADLAATEVIATGVFYGTADFDPDAG